MLTAVLIIADLLQVITAAATNASIPPKCYEKATDFYPYLSTRTAYTYVHGYPTRADPSCTPVQLWMLSRHGTRFPGKKVIPKMLNLVNLRDQIIQNHQQGAGLLCSSDLDKLRDWQLDPNLNMQTADLLAPQGEEDLRSLAERLKEVFPELLNVDPQYVRQEDFVFRATDTQRAQASMQAFSTGLFGTNQTIVQPVNPPANDTLLLAQNYCPAWLSGYEIDHVNAERDKFTAGPEIRAILRDVARRLGFSRDFDFDTVRAMYDMCRFETAWHPDNLSTWCLVFRRNELKVMEYRDDLDYYYFCGPGRPMSAKIGCQTLSDMFEHFKTLASGNFTNQPKGVFYFAHTITLQTLMAALRLDEDTTPLLASNFAQEEDRKFSISKFGPFATNIVAVFYRCSGSKSPYKVTIHRAENLVKMPGCEDGLCDWDYLQEKYASDVANCSMDFCYETHGGAATQTYSTLFMVLMIVSSYILM